MKGLGFRICVLGSIAVVLLPFPRSEASSYCPGCEAGVIGAAIGVGAGIGVGIYFIHRSHTSLTGCVREIDSGLSATAKDGNNYQLVNAPSKVKAGERFSLRGPQNYRSFRACLSGGQRIPRLWCVQPISRNATKGAPTRPQQAASESPPLYIERPSQSHPQRRMLHHCTKNRHFRAIAYPSLRAENACAKES